jgi:hypothetical protein
MHFRKPANKWQTATKENCCIVELHFALHNSRRSTNALDLDIDHVLTKELQFTTARRASANRFSPRKSGSSSRVRQKRVARRIPHRLWRALVWNDAPVASRPGASFSRSLFAVDLPPYVSATVYLSTAAEGGRAGWQAGALLCALKGRANSLTANFSCKLLP